MLFWLFNPWDTRWLIVISVILLSVGTSGDYILEDVLFDLVNDADKRNKKRSRVRAKIWSRVAYMFGAVSSTLWVAVGATGGFYKPSWSSSLLICIITMTVTLVIFCMGHNIYHQGELTKRPVEVFLRVFRDPTGFTFFLQQYNNLNVSNYIPIQVYGLDQDLSRVVIPILYNRIRFSPKNEKFKIGVGMLCGILSCIFAWKVEVYRLKAVHRLDKEDSTTSMSFLWLVSQFCALGCIEGLTLEGLLKFYRSQIKEKSLRSYGEEYIEIVMGLGKVMNIFLILVFNNKTGWFSYFYKDQADLANRDQTQANQGFPANHDQTQAN
ncbi:hypothetical protein L1987_50335 [Smallanthus sonchifolius]|uniref:Uncharacterized protein n=1 Tax=Smallanthus sonchifolius TaxID=185202 RepID=A0ACB9EN12_9ASTR|nr:hypothetical protein L1987_50335 [Smallanthus sonchifolius]